MKRRALAELKLILESAQKKCIKGRHLVRFAPVINCEEGDIESKGSRPGRGRPVFLVDECETFFAEVNVADSDRTWISGRPAVRLSGRNIYDLQRLALAGRLRYQALAGETIRFRIDDLLELAAEKGARPAVATA
jgi:hypothetical protein